MGTLAAPFRATNPFGALTVARGPVPGGYLMKTSPETTRASKVLPGTGAREPSEVSWSSGMPSLSRSPELCWLLEPPAPGGAARGAATVKVSGGLKPLIPLFDCVACAVYCPSGSGCGAVADHVVALRVAAKVWTGAPAGRAPL